ncbi:zinc finger protein 830 [Brachyhypopomus gauderio]|uniref:zinc finger protein 830 n=1 Tax=Brachyhypopomus gauderio TaxID=698409 RepID=UPI00404264E5
MASKGAKGKKVVNQDELRRLMREKKRSSERQKRVESPYAKYNSVGQLSCVVCGVQVKSEMVWQAHVLGRNHRDRVAELKGGKQSPADTTQTPQPSTVKRRAPEPEPKTGKRAKTSRDGGVTSADLPSGFFDEKSAADAPSTHSAGLGLLAGQYEDEDEEGVKEKGDQTGGQGGLPSDFFDSGVPDAHDVSHSGSVSKADEEKVAEKKENMAEALPEGFFDDPVRDAKVRNVDTPKDQMDKEWEEFQKEMRQVNNASDAIVAEDDEEGRIERQIDEIDQQIECFRRVEVLRAKQDVVKGKAAEHKSEEVHDPSGSDEEDEEELLHVLSRDWRAKGALA